MKFARLLKNNEKISVDNIKNGLVKRSEDFIDIEEDFRVTYVSKSKNNGQPYFRLYFCYEDYKNLTKEEIDNLRKRYDILKKLRHEENCEWHNEWENKIKEIADIERAFKIDGEKGYRIPDGFIEEKSLCIEFQHSYLANDLINKTNFYSELGFKTLWLFDLTGSDIKEEDNKIFITEKNSKGFFRICRELNDDLNNYLIFIQTKNRNIYRVKFLFRKENEDNDFKSSIRFFEKDLEMKESEFVEFIRNENIESLETCINKEKKIMVKNCTLVKVKSSKTFKDGFDNKQHYENFYITLDDNKWIPITVFQQNKSYKQIQLSLLSKIAIEVEKAPWEGK